MCRYFESVEADRKTGKKLKGSIPLVKTERVTLENPRLLIHNPGRVRGSFPFFTIIPFNLSDICCESEYHLDNIDCAGT